MLFVATICELKSLLDDLRNNRNDIGTTIAVINEIRKRAEADENVWTNLGTSDHELGRILLTGKVKHVRQQLNNNFSNTEEIVSFIDEIRQKSLEVLGRAYTLQDFGLTGNQFKKLQTK